jgi:hypothetical protein
MPTIKVGVREFRERIASFLESDTPVAVTRHGETLGVYVPTPRKRRKTADLSELKAASDRLAEALAAGSAEFFASPSLEQLAESQGVTSLKRPADLAGGWPHDESVDDFLDLTYRNRA